MTIPGGCACGCGKPLTGSEFWSDEGCVRKWLAQVDGFAGRVEVGAAGDIMPAEPGHARFVEPVELTGEQLEAIREEIRRARFDRVYLNNVVAAGPDATLPARAGAEYPQVASENPQVECGQPDWLARAFGRLFGKGAV